MGFWAKSLVIFNSLCGNATQSLRQLAHLSGFSKSSVHRLKQAMERRDRHPESWFWETDEGRRWCIRLVVATLYTFGLKRAVGAEVTVQVVKTGITPPRATSDRLRAAETEPLHP